MTSLLQSKVFSLSGLVQEAGVTDREFASLLKELSNDDGIVIGSPFTFICSVKADNHDEYPSWWAKIGNCLRVTYNIPHNETVIIM